MLQDLFVCCRTCFPVLPAAVVKAGLEPVMAVHDHNIMMLAGFHFPDHFLHTLMLLLEATTEQTTTPAMWGTFMAIVDKPRGALRSLTPALLAQAVDMVHRHLLETRGSGVPLFQGWVAFVDPVLALYRTLCDGLLTAATPAVTVFSILRQLYEPWLLPLLVEGEAHNPWQPYREEMQAASRFVVHLRGVCTKLSYPPGQYLPLLWDMLFDRLYPAAPHHVLDVIHDAMIDLPWEKLVLTPTILDTQLEVLIANPAGAASFVASIVARADLQAAVGSCEAGHGEVSYVLNRLLQIALTLAGLAATTVGLPEVLPPLLDAVSQLPWELLLLEDYTQRCENFLTNATAIQVFAASTETVRTLQGRRSLRCCCRCVLHVPA